MNIIKSLRERYGATAEHLRLQRRLELVVLILMIVLIIQLLYGAARLASLTPLEAISSAADSLHVRYAIEKQVASADERQEFRERPLFWPSRRVESEVETTEQELGQSQLATIEGVKLVGIFVSADSTGIIVLLDGEKRRLQVGDELNNWRVKSVSAQEVVLFADGRERRLLLRPDAGT